MAQKGNPVVGQACTVTSGPHKGKKGKYTRDDEGNLWCEGDWGGTECEEGKCKDAEAQVSIFEYIDTAGVLVYEIDGLINVEGLGIFQFNTIMDAASGVSRKMSAVPIVATSLTALKESSSEVERRVAVLLESHLKGQDSTY